MNFLVWYAAQCFSTNIPVHYFILSRSLLYNLLSIFVQRLWEKCIYGVQLLSLFASRLLSRKSTKTFISKYWDIFNLYCLDNLDSLYHILTYKLKKLIYCILKLYMFIKIIKCIIWNSCFMHISIVRYLCVSKLCVFH